MLNSSNFFIKSLTHGKLRISFRNNQGKALAHRGGGHKRNHVLVDYVQPIWHLRGFVISLVYDPNRAARLACVSYSNGVVSYVLAPLGVYPGTTLYSDYNAEFTPGSRFYLWQLPLGSRVFNVELKAGAGGLVARAAGVFSTIIRKTHNFIVLKLPSKELKIFPLSALATIGQVNSSSNQFINLRKAGAVRWLGRRPVVRGVAKNPVDHPHGGGEGKTSGGRPSVTPWGKITKGQPTRSKKKLSTKTILRFRNGLTNTKSYVYK